MRKNRIAVGVVVALAVITWAGSGLSWSADRQVIRSFYKVSHISQSVVGISCPGNGGDPTAITNVSGTLLVSCGTP